MTSVRFRLPETMSPARIDEILCRGDHNAIEALVVRILRDSAVAAALRLFLAALPEPRMVFADYPNDFALLANALGGFGEGFTGDMTAWQADEVTQGDVLMCRDMYFDFHPEVRNRRHYASVDAIALRWGFESVMNGGTRIDRQG